MKKDENLPKSKKVDRDRETRVLLERMHSDIQRIAENNKQFVELKETINGLVPLKSEVKTISMAVMELSGDLKKLDKKVDALDGKVNAIDNRLKVVDNKIDVNLANHEKRITRIEEKVPA